MLTTRVRTPQVWLVRRFFVSNYQVDSPPDYNMQVALVAGDFERLLHRVAEIKRTNDRITELKKESFNIFSLLRKDNDEVYLHSAFIADLLNPSGTHHMGFVFAELFFETVGIEFSITNNTTVEAEKYLNSGLGRADIFLKTESRQAIIENKIDAADQYMQLQRYQEYLDANRQRTGVLIYLTRDGRASPEDKSSDGQSVTYHQLSYREDILAWLQRCQEKAVNHPPLRETIKQYIFLVRKLTGQLTNDEMTDQLAALIRQNYVAADLISKQITTIKVEAVASFLKNLASRLKEELGDGWIVNKSNTKFTAIASKNYTSLVIAYKGWDKAVRVEVQGQPTSINHPTVYGVVAHEEEVDRSAIEGQLRLADISDQHLKTLTWWPWQDNLFDFGQPEELAKLFDEQTQEEYLSDTVSKVLSLCKSCEQKLSVPPPNKRAGS